MSSKDNRGVLIVEPPSQVRFSGPFTRPVVTTVTLINPTDYKIIFKIKTTAPSFYGVRPNFGVVQPRNFTEVEIARQPFNYDQNEKINHKFMVQSLMVPTTVEDLNKVWENADSAQLNATKLRCVFEMPTSKNQQSLQPSQVKKLSSQSVHALQTKATSTTQEFLPVESSALTPKTILKNTSHHLLAAQDNKPSPTVTPIQSPPQLIQVTQLGPPTATVQEPVPPAKPLQPVQPVHISPSIYQDSDDKFTKAQLDNLNKEMRNLHAENNVLRKENTMLKDEIEQMRVTPVRREVTVPHSPIFESPDATTPVPFIYVLTSVSIAVFSIFLGKYVL